MLAGEPSFDEVAVELLDAVGRRRRAEHVSVLGQGGEHHVRAHRRHQHRVAEHGANVEHPDAVAEQCLQVRDDPAALALDLLLGSTGVDEAAQAGDQLGGVELLGADGLDRCDRAAERIQAGEHRVDGFA